MYWHSSHLRDEDLFQRRNRNCRISSTVQIVLPAQLKLPFNGNFFPDFQVQGSFVHGSKSWATGSHLSLLAAFRGLTWCSSQIIKAGPRMPALSSWMFHNDLQSTEAQTSLTSTRIPQGTMGKSGLERDTTNWAEIRKADRVGGLSHSNP